jgi:hypothetical protein
MVAFTLLNSRLTVSEGVQVQVVAGTNSATAAGLVRAALDSNRKGTENRGHPPFRHEEPQMDIRNREQRFRSKNVGRKIGNEIKVLKFFAPHFSTDSFGLFVRTDV